MRRPCHKEETTMRKYMEVKIDVCNITEEDVIRTSSIVLGEDVFDEDIGGF